MVSAETVIPVFSLPVKINQCMSIFVTGLLLPEFLKEFGEEEVSTAWIIGGLNGITQLFGK